jgi:hypothetical protein
LFHHVRILMLLVPNHREDLCASTSHHLVAHLLEYSDVIRPVIPKESDQ